MLLLRKGGYPYNYMNNWGRFNQRALPEKEKFYNNLSMGDIQRVYKDFEIKRLGQYHDFYLKSDVILLTSVFENFRKMCLEIYELDLAKFILALGLAWQAALKKTQLKLDLITDTDMLLIIEKGIRGGI